MVFLNQNRMNHFKNMLRSYEFFIQEKENLEFSIESSLKHIELIKDSMVIEPKSVSFDRVAVQGSPDYHKIEQDRLERVDEAYSRIDRTEQKIRADRNNLRIIERKIEMINQFISYCDKDIGQAAFRIYCLNESTFNIEAKRLFIERKTLQRRMNEEIVNFFKDVPRDIVFMY